MIKKFTILGITLLIFFIILANFFSSQNYQEMLYQLIYKRSQNAALQLVENQKLMHKLQTDSSILSDLVGSQFIYKSKEKEINLRKKIFILTSELNTQPNNPTLLNLISRVYLKLEDVYLSKLYKSKYLEINPL